MTYVEANPNLIKNLCIECSRVLQNKYPHMAWGVKPTVDGSMIQFMPVGVGADPDYVYTIATTDIQETTGRTAKLMKIGGEVLERYKIHRAKKEFEGTMPNLSKRGFLVPDKT